LKIDDKLTKTDGVRASAAVWNFGEECAQGD
jgi:hypothetical protein